MRINLNLNSRKPSTKSRQNDARRPTTTTAATNSRIVQLARNSQNLSSAPVSFYFQRSDSITRHLAGLEQQTRGGESRNVILSTNSSDNKYRLEQSVPNNELRRLSSMALNSSSKRGSITSGHSSKPTISISTMNTLGHATRVAAGIVSDEDEDYNERDRLNKQNQQISSSQGDQKEPDNSNHVNKSDTKGRRDDKNADAAAGGFFKKLLNKNKKKKTPSIDINELIKPSPILPMVKFDDDGDFFKEPLEIKIDDTLKDEDQGHVIRISNKLAIDTRKVKKYMKQGFKFAFSQIGLAGLVVGYVVLGALLFMKVESEYEKEVQTRIDENREKFFENVKLSAESLFNDYLEKNFHKKYSEFRNEEIRLRDEELIRRRIYAQSLMGGGGIDNNAGVNIDHPSNANKTLSNSGDEIDSNTNSYMDNSQTSNFFLNSQFYSPRSLRSRDTGYIDENQQGDQQDSSQQDMSKGSGENKKPKEEVRYDKKTHQAMMKANRSVWKIELDRHEFYTQMKNHLMELLMANDKMEDKEKQVVIVREDLWSFSNALLYCATVITTIGYGNITPKSPMGKILTIFYAMIGIPLMFMCLTNTGDLLAELFITSYSKCIRFFYKRMFKHKLKIPYSSSKFQENKEEMLNEFELEYDNPNDRHVPIVATLGVLTGYIFAGAGIFTYTERWSILDGAYFCFITFTTIGFGDFVPGKNTLATEKRGMAALCTLYLLVGMVIMAMCLKLMQDEVIAKARYFGRRLGIIDN